MGGTILDQGAASGEGKQEVITFTQEDVTAKLTEAKNGWLKELGLEGASNEDIKTRLSALSEFEESQKTDSELSDEKFNAEKERADSAEQKAMQLERCFEAVKLGVPADRAERYAKLAESYMDENTDFSAALNKAVEDFPVVGTNPIPPGAFGTGVKGARQKAVLAQENDVKKIFAQRG